MFSHTVSKAQYIRVSTNFRALLLINQTLLLYLHGKFYDKDLDTFTIHGVKTKYYEESSVIAPFQL